MRLAAKNAQGVLGEPFSPMRFARQGSGERGEVGKTWGLGGGFSVALRTDQRRRRRIRRLPSECKKAGGPINDVGTPARPTHEALLAVGLEGRRQSRSPLVRHRKQVVRDAAG